MTRTSPPVVEPAALAKFPNFRDGDPAVAFTATRVYRLHLSVLERNSKYFSETLHMPGPKLNKQAREENAAAHRLEYRKHPENEQHPGFWIRLDVHERGRFEFSSTLLPEIPNGKLRDPKHRQWEWLFGIFYKKQPGFYDDTLGSVLYGCMDLIDVAESVGSADHVRKVVDLALLQQGKAIWSSISNKPRCLGGACMSHPLTSHFQRKYLPSRGKWLMCSEEEKADLSEDIRILCAAKVKELDIAKEASEMRILVHYPDFLYRKAIDKPGRPSYASDIYMWIALDFFRQWFAQNISNGNNRKAEDGGYKFYKDLSLGGAAYLDHEDFRIFHQYFPMSSEACAILERDMGSLKEDIKPFVRDLMKSQVHLDIAQHHEINWLTCTVVYKDCPWVKKATAEDEAAANQKDGDEQMFFEDAPLPDRSIRYVNTKNSSAAHGSASPAAQDNEGLSMELKGTRTYYDSDTDE